MGSSSPQHRADPAPVADRTGGSRSWIDPLVARLPARFRPAARRVVDRDLLTAASSLAFYGLLSTMPTLMVAFAVVAAVAGEQALSSFADQVSRSGPEGTEQLLDRLINQSDTIDPVMLLFIVWPATAYGAGLRRVLTRESGRDDPPGLRGLHGRLLGLSFVIALPVLLLAGVPLMIVLTALSGDGALATAVGWLIAVAGATLLGAAMTTLIYQTFAPEDLTLTDSVGAAVAASLLTTLFSVAFVAYLGVGNLEDRFGGGIIGIVILFGVWLFVANIVLLAGYHVVAARNDGNRTTTREEEG